MWGKVLTVALLATTLTACTSDEPVAAPPPPPATTSTTPPPPPPDSFHGLAKTPCATLSDTQREDLKKQGVPLLPGEPDEHNRPVNCLYGDYANRPSGSFMAWVIYQEGRSMKELEDDHARGFSKEYWKPAEFAGHQAVAYTHQGSPENCDIAIAVADATVVVQLIHFDDMASRETHSCKATTKVATEVVKTIDSRS
ncbi:DUF3558 domain-containing protein [Amycolatopsis sp. OK19-0408]|uniref:DUF3558 domain-containing protein n=1 Tax=Amycolatopsis iheyensis TaxID=2945988 RepID=A0A9X2NPG1_9PSEU|nr:DUF3558 domain-containing protein [Amycolatopsis iheyensis]MCR6490502.1 DUF3558 domain-containing protein [Amycolatopsis iheyensis]